MARENRYHVVHMVTMLVFVYNLFSRQNRRCLLYARLHLRLQNKKNLTGCAGWNCLQFHPVSSIVTSNKNDMAPSYSLAAVHLLISAIALLHGSIPQSITSQLLTYSPWSANLAPIVAHAARAASQAQNMHACPLAEDAVSVF